MAPDGGTDGWMDMDKTISLHLRHGITTIRSVSMSQF